MKTWQFLFGLAGLTVVFAYAAYRVLERLYGG